MFVFTYDPLGGNELRADELLLLCIYIVDGNAALARSVEDSM